MDAWCQQKPGSVAVFDATNSTPDRRKLITNFCERLQLDVMFVELITNDKTMLENNIREVKIMSPDYKHFNNPEEAVADFKVNQFWLVKLRIEFFFNYKAEHSVVCYVYEYIVILGSSMATLA